MHFPCTRRKRHVHDPLVKFRKHVVAQLGVPEPYVLSRNHKASVEYLRHVGKVVAMFHEVRFSLCILPRAGTVLAHSLTTYVILLIAASSLQRAFGGRYG